jgi:hypothetical protein
MKAASGEIQTDGTRRQWGKPTPNKPYPHYASVYRFASIAEANNWVIFSASSPMKSLGSS